MKFFVGSLVACGGWLALSYYFSRKLRIPVLEVLLRMEGWKSARVIRAELKRRGLHAPPPTLFFTMKWLIDSGYVCRSLKLGTKEPSRFAINEEGAECLRIGLLEKIDKKTGYKEPINWDAYGETLGEFDEDN
jgi:hypothetical protein